MRRLIAVFTVLFAALATTACDPDDLALVVTTLAVDAVDATPGDGVCETANPGECTIRAAVQEANANAAAHPGASATIELPSASGWTATLVGADDVGAVGDLDVHSTIAIDGNVSTLDGATVSRLFDVHPGGNLRLVDIRLTRGGTSLDGNGPGGAVRNAGGFAMQGGSISQSATATGGWAIHQLAGATTLVRVHVLNNGMHAITPSGPSGPTPSGPGAAVWNASGALDVVSSTISGNLTTFPAAFPSGGIYQAGGSSQVIASTIGDHAATFEYCMPGPHPLCNTFVWKGDGMRVAGGTASVLRSTLHGNERDIAGAAAPTVEVGATVLHRCSARVTSLGYNRDVDSSCLAPSSPTDILAGPPVIEFNATPPAGYPQQPAAIHPSAIADVIPPGTPVLCDSSSAVDGYGLPRPIGGGCDVGAIER